jgi:hypothetical protein
MYNYKLFRDNKDLKPKELLIKIKKLLPKHLNSIPDNAAISIFETIKKTKVIQKNIINVSLYKKFFFSQNIFKDKGF